MNSILSIDTVNNTACVEAGVVLAQFKESIAAEDRFFPLALGSEGSCQIGGNIASNAGGNSVLRYGMMRESVLGLEVVLPDGSIHNNLHGLRKYSRGYDLDQLFIGSEGTLGIITKAIVKLHPKPRAVVTAWIGCDDLDRVMALLEEFKRRCGDRLTCFEVMNRSIRRIVHAYAKHLRDPLNATTEWAIIAEFSDTGTDEQLLEIIAPAIESALTLGLANDAVIASNSAQQKSFWTIRESVPDASLAYGWPITHDASVPLSAVARFAAEVEAKVTHAYPDATFTASGHAGDGNIHVGFIFRRDEIASRDAYEAITRAINTIVFDCAHRFGGNFASEHGIGVSHVKTLRHYASDTQIRMMEQIKDALDPNRILNPGKLFPPPQDHDEHSGI